MSLREYNKLSFGNILEGYNISLYIYFSSYIAYDFFPHSDSHTRLIMALSAFFVGSLLRPVGGMISGWLGDRYSPAAIVNYCVIFIGVSTFLTALIPGYDSIGMAAPILLTALRVVQGLSSGGLMPNLIAMSINQHQAQSAQAIGGSFSVSTLGFLLASLVGFVMTQYFDFLPRELMWRLAFSLSGILLFFYLLLNWRNEYPDRNSFRESSLYSAAQAMARQRRSIFIVVLLTTVCSSLYYLVFTYMLNHQILHLDYEHEHAFMLNSLMLVIACIAYPMFGAIADRLGLLTVFWLAASVFMLALIPCVELIHQSLSVVSFSGLALLVLLSAAIQASVSPLFAQLFAPQWRATGCAFSFGIGNAIGGGVPLLALKLVQLFPHYGLVYLMAALLLLGCMGMLLARRGVPIQPERQSVL